MLKHPHGRAIPPLTFDALLAAVLGAIDHCKELLRELVALRLLLRARLWRRLGTWEHFAILHLLREGRVERERS
jgi:hypothetical protein